MGRPHGGGKSQFNPHTGAKVRVISGRYSRKLEAVAGREPEAVVDPRFLRQG